ncbi:uncharacterized protein BBA_07108 [Beauveria bassiana ARSEF 2860]|uniref:Uncharacterized protein n=1 Tax=Beauveria bassiana (strain ARSEF 2860) TaxID=655819 RepID=J4KMD9_BEAB2|nr:uncharacterized protein BBA_07108 [Beauveria bassiana ARSEF 2860]EJP63784.1 hypothetical protein BBA_07108 [Beauveria bassiana ARSEF 2860]
MRYSLAVLGLAAAVSATAVDAKVGVDANAQVAAGAAVGAKVGADVNAQVSADAGAGAGAGVDAKVDADVAAGANVDAQVAADVAAGAKAGAGAAAGVDVNTKVDAGAAAGFKVGAGVGVGAKLGAGKTIDAQVSADVDAQVANISAKYRGGAAVNPSIHAGAGLGLSAGGNHNVTTDAGLRVDAAVEAAIAAAVEGFSCPATMAYSPWTQACSCAPGLFYSATTGSCTGGARLLNAWPAPALQLFASVHVKLAAFCAASPVKMCRYDAAHEFCQAGLDTIAFVAEAKIGNELDKLGSSAAIDVAGNVSAELKAVSAGLHGLYLEKVEDAVALFNSRAYGLQVLDANMEAGFITKTQLVLCKLGLGSCQRDCVSFSGKGCANHIDIGAPVGAQITGLINGVCILPSVILVVNQARVLVSVAVEHLLCVVGNVMKTLMATFDCHCK